MMAAATAWESWSVGGRVIGGSCSELSAEHWANSSVVDTMSFLSNSMPLIHTICPTNVVMSQQIYFT